jgi:hypothetical protein
MIQYKVGYQRPGQDFEELHQTTVKREAWRYCWQLARSLARIRGIPRSALGEYAERDGGGGVCPEGDDGGSWPIVCVEEVLC